MSKIRRLLTEAKSETSPEMYARLCKEMDKSLNDLKIKLAEHKKSQAKHPLDYGYSGDLAYWLEKIQIITNPEE